MKQRGTKGPTSHLELLVQHFPLPLIFSVLIFTPVDPKLKLILFIIILFSFISSPSVQNPVHDPQRQSDFPLLTKFKKNQKPKIK